MVLLFKSISLGVNAVISSLLIPVYRKILKNGAYLCLEFKSNSSCSCVKISFSLKISEYLKESDFEDPEKMEEMPFIEGFSLDTDALINNEIIVNWPMKVLCKPDCKGICRVCGKDLNEGDCGCDTFVPDPRMAVIKDIFNA